MLKDAESELTESKPSGVKRLGIDEIALIKGQGKYCAVLIDLDTSELLAILPSRKQEDIRKVLMEWRLEVLEAIEEVSIDLWQGYPSSMTPGESKIKVERPKDCCYYDTAQNS